MYMQLSEKLKGTFRSFLISSFKNRNHFWIRSATGEEGFNGLCCIYQQTYILLQVALTYSTLQTLLDNLCMIGGCYKSGPVGPLWRYSRNNSFSYYRLCTADNRHLIYTLVVTWHRWKAFFADARCINSYIKYSNLFSFGPSKLWMHLLVTQYCC